MTNKPLPPQETSDISRAPWMTTMVDAVALILTFFVMLFSMTTVNTQQWSAVTESIGQELNKVNKQQGSRLTGEEEKTLSIFRKFAIDLDYLQSVIERKIQDSPDLAGVQVQLQGDHMIIQMPSDLLFDAGSDILTDKARKAIFRLTDMLMNIRNRVDVEGHTDPAPISTDMFKDNWQLSLARAERVAAYMKVAGFRRPLAAKGYADTRFGDLDPQSSGGNMYAAARRVNIVIYAEGEGQ